MEPTKQFSEPVVGLLNKAVLWAKFSSTSWECETRNLTFYPANNIRKYARWTMHNKCLRGLPQRRQSVLFLFCPFKRFFREVARARK
uniref:Ribosomal_L18A domain-containing protein n=1 Tax=Steinernema glaseri TaxID=37863 RepID=A0A1I7YJD4_9BILA